MLRREPSLNLVPPLARLCGHISAQPRHWLVAVLFWVVLMEVLRRSGVMDAEYQSSANLLGWPLLACGQAPRAWLSLGSMPVGLIAIGDVPVGVVAMGGVALGAVAIGGLGVGLLTFGGVALALLAAVGGMAVGYYGMGGLSIAAYAYAGRGVAYGIFLADGAQRERLLWPRGRAAR